MFALNPFFVDRGLNNRFFFVMIGKNRIITSPYMHVSVEKCEKLRANKNKLIGKCHTNILFCVCKRELSLKNDDTSDFF